MTQTHWRQITNPLYLGAYSLEPNKDIILTIKTVTREMVTGADGKKEECTIIKFSEQTKPMICNNTNAKMISKIYGTPYIEEWSGRSIQLYVDHNVRLGKEIIDGLRIRPIVPKQSAPIVPVCVDCAAEIKEHQGASGQAIANATYQKYGKPLCLECAEKEKNKKKAAEIPDPLREGADIGNDT